MKLPLRRLVFWALAIVSSPLLLARKCVAWLFAPSLGKGASWPEVIWWWELRRIPYNAIVAVWAIISFLTYVVALVGSGHLQPGEDLLEPMAYFAALLVGPLAINACYSLGWLVELALRLAEPEPRMVPRIAPSLLKAGIVFSMVIIGLPAILWVVEWVFGS